MLWRGFGGVLREMFGEVFGTCLGGLGWELERFFDSFREVV